MFLFWVCSLTLWFCGPAPGDAGDAGDAGGRHHGAAANSGDAKSQQARKPKPFVGEELVVHRMREARGFVGFRVWGVYSGAPGPSPERVEGPTAPCGMTSTTQN